MISTLQFKRGLKSTTSYVAIGQELSNGEGEVEQVALKCVQAILEKYKDVMPPKLPKKLPLRWEVDHQIELELGVKPWLPIIWHLELAELKNKTSLMRAYIRPFKAHYDASILS